MAFSILSSSTWLPRGPAYSLSLSLFSSSLFILYRYSVSRHSLMRGKREPGPKEKQRPVQATFRTYLMNSSKGSAAPEESGENPSKIASTNAALMRRRWRRRCTGRRGSCCPTSGERSSAPGRTPSSGYSPVCTTLATSPLSSAFSKSPTLQRGHPSSSTPYIWSS